MRGWCAAAVLIFASAAAAPAAAPSLRRCRELCEARLETCATQRCSRTYLNRICKRDRHRACAPRWKIPAQPLPPVPGNPPLLGPLVTVKTRNGTITMSRPGASTVAFHFQPSGGAGDWMWFCTDDIAFLQNDAQVASPAWVPDVLCRRFDLVFDHRVTAELGPGMDPARPLTVRQIAGPTDIILDAVTTSTSSTSTTSTSSTSSTTVIPPP